MTHIDALDAQTPERATGLHRVIARNMKRRRRDLDMTQQGLADRMAFIGWTRSTVATIENGIRKVDLNELAPLCVALDTDLRGLLEAAGDPDVGNAVNALLPGAAPIGALEEALRQFVDSLVRERLSAALRV